MRQITAIPIQENELEVFVKKQPFYRMKATPIIIQYSSADFIIEHINAVKKWPPFCTRRFQKHFCESKILQFDSEKCTWGSKKQIDYGLVTNVQITSIGHRYIQYLKQLDAIKQVNNKNKCHHNNGFVTCTGATDKQTGQALIYLNMIMLSYTTTNISMA